MIKLSNVYNSVSESDDKQNDKVYVKQLGSLRDGGSIPIEFSDGFTCMFDNGLNSSTKHKFVKSWKDRTIIDLDKKYKDALIKSEAFEKKEFLI